MPSHITYPTVGAATQRSRELWLAVLGRAKHAQDVTEYAYSVLTRHDDPEAEQPLPDGVDVAIVVHSRDAMLDTLIRADQMTADEIAALVGLYDEWQVDTDYSADDLRTFGGTLYKCVQGHRSQADYTPDATPALWTHAAPAGVIPEWVQPTGAHDAYNTGDRVTFQGRCGRAPSTLMCGLPACMAGFWCNRDRCWHPVAARRPGANAGRVAAACVVRLEIRPCGDARLHAHAMGR